MPLGFARAGGLCFCVPGNIAGCRRFMFFGTPEGKVGFMKRRRIWSIAPPLIALAATLLLAVAATYFLNRSLFYIELAALVLVFGFAAVWMAKKRSGIRRTLETVAESLAQSDREALSGSPFPGVACTSQGEILWYNRRFASEVLKNRDMLGEPLSAVTGGVGLSGIAGRETVEVSFGRRSYTAYISSVMSENGKIFILYYIDNTEHKRIAEEYVLSKPAVILFYIDNIDEIFQNARDSERAQITSKVENLLEDWTSKANGLFRRYSSDRYILIVEQRDLQAILLKKFDILDRVRSIQTGVNINVTLSIGVGQGSTLKESEQYARQALDMALGRGGDQAAVKTKNGFDFYGGLSQGIERRTRVRTRVVASTLLELIQSSENVLVMGHRFSDLDCLGSSAALVSCIRSLDRQAYVVVRRGSTLAPELLQKYEDADRGDLFIEPESALPLVSDKTLLVITDTHTAAMLESEEVWRAAKSVVIIDHHRKMVDFIDNAVVFHNAPYASSTAEMVAEIIQYLEGATLSKLDAEALLAGIMLDTRNFVIKSGVRTFEAAAFLRRMGADTIEVKRLLAGGLRTHREKADILAKAEVIDNFAVAVSDIEGGSSLKVAASQAADELLYIQGVEASFVVVTMDRTVNISARSFGKVNVQVIMEKLGGGGHFTMAGAQLAGVSPQQAKQQLMSAIMEYLSENNRPAPDEVTM
jgi:c-di-AMP phosphodiesterase-like protein